MCASRAGTRVYAVRVYAYFKRRDSSAVFVMLDSKLVPTRMESLSKTHSTPNRFCNEGLLGKCDRLEYWTGTSHSGMPVGGAGAGEVHQYFAVTISELVMRHDKG